MGKRILVVDDNRVLLKFLSNLLEKEGHEVRTAEDGFAALSTLAGFNPEILLVDLIMPKIGGDKLCQIVRKLQGMAECYIVVISAAVAEFDLDLAAIGADTCIAKGPFGKMAEHVLAAVQAADAPQRGAPAGQIVGAESLFVRQMTKELLSRNRHLQTILESMGEGILEIFGDRIVYANSAALKLFDCPEERLLTAYPPDLFEPVERHRIVELFMRPVDEIAKVGWRSPIELGGRLVAVKLLPVQGAEQTRIMLINDVTERKNLELQLQHIQKMEAVGTIASGVAHNFRNTLAGILMNSQVIQLTYPDDPELITITDRINTSVRRGSELVEGLLQFSRKQMRKAFERIDLVQVVEEIHQIICKSFDQRIEIVLDLPTRLFVEGDHSGLHLALLNLCTNARDAMPGGGRLTIGVWPREGQAEMQVVDTGCGMDADALKKCFDPFYTTKAVGSGTGLGLSTTYGIVKSHGGRIEVRSTPGQGTCFTLSIPLVEPPAAAEPPPAPAPPHGRGEKVLVVDDDREFLEAIPPLLKALGYQVALADNPRSGLSQYRDWRPHVVLMDRSMPAGDGLACTEQILEIDPGARIVIVSGYAANGPDGLDNHHRDRIRGYLTKPVEIGELGRMLHAILAPHDAPDET